MAGRDQQRAEYRPASGECREAVMLEIITACDPDHSAYRGLLRRSMKAYTFTG
jgi:hypothetical protein